MNQMMTLFPYKFHGQWQQIQEQLYGKTNSDNSRLDAGITERPQTLDRKNAPETLTLGASDVRHRVTITMYRCGRPLDRGNLFYASKALEDGLVQAGFIQDDAICAAEINPIQIKVKTRKEVRTEIVIEEIP